MKTKIIATPKTLKKHKVDFGCYCSHSNVMMLRNWMNELGIVGK